MSISISMMDIFQSEVVDIECSEDEEYEFVYIKFFIPMIGQFLHTCTLYTSLHTYISAVGDNKLNKYELTEQANKLLKEICIAISVGVKGDLNVAGINNLSSTT